MLAVYGLADSLEEQEKWDEFDSIWREWRDVVDPPGFFELGQNESLELEEGQDADAGLDDDDAQGTTGEEQHLCGDYYREESEQEVVGENEDGWHRDGRCDVWQGKRQDQFSGQGVDKELGNPGDTLNLQVLVS